MGHRLPTPTAAEQRQLNARVAQRITRLLRRRGLLEPDADLDAPTDEEALLIRCHGASITGTIAFGERTGQRVDRAGPIDPSPTGRAGATRGVDGYSLHVGRPVPAEDRAGLERLCRHVARPPVPDARLDLRADGRVQLALRRPYPDGTTHLIFEPLQFIEKLAALVGPPRANLLHYHGYLAPCASWRDKIVPAPPEPEPARHIDAPLERFGQPPPLPPRPTGTRWFPWALLLWRSLQIDALLCPRCGSRMKILAYLTDPPVVEAVLDALELPSQAPTVSPARSQLQLEYCQAPPGPRPARMVCALGAQGKMAGRRPPEPGQ